ncbi:MAG TPA: translocation protein TolB [Acidobacteriaceae bacterium]|nr:translocation protein TolB [Acidobacteriaceae bacterium]
MKSTISSHRPPSPRFTLAALSFMLTALLTATTAHAQDNIFTGTNSGATKIRIAVPDFKASAADANTAEFRQIYNVTLYADLATAGIFDIVSKSLLPSATPGAPAEMHALTYANSPVGASFVAFGSFGVEGGRLVVYGYLFDTKNAQYPQVLAKKYSELPNDDSAREIAHRFANEIILRLGGGTPGIAETKIYYVKKAGADKDIWVMDYDGANQHQLTRLGTDVMSPRISPDNSRIAFASLGKYGFQLKMYSLLLSRYVNFPAGTGNAAAPAWAPNGKEIAYASAPNGAFDIWISDSNGNLARKVTAFRGGNISPVFNPRTGDQIALISGRTGLPQLYIMNADGSSVQQMTDGGYASSPSWSPNGQFIAFAWDRKYGPGAPGGQDIYIMEVATKKWWQLTHEGGRCDFPTWSPDGRHIAYANSSDGRAEHTRVWTMLSDGSQQRPLTGAGSDMPNWSWK